MERSARAAWLASDGRLLSLRVAYPVVGVVLALCLALGLIAVRILASESSLGMLDELQANSVTYAYVLGANAALLGFLGYGLGAREDVLWATSITDPLTQVANRRHFETELQEELARAQASRMPLALLMCDLDHLKRINDGGGHSAGDAALRTLADVIARGSRARDLTARFGGDEFVIVMPRTRATEAWSLAERIRATLATEWETTKHHAKVGPLTVSIGIADLDVAGDDVITPASLFEAADRALYLAKESGRDRAVVASQLDDTQVTDLARLPMRNTHPGEPAPGLVRALLEAPKEEIIASEESAPDDALDAQSDGNLVAAESSDDPSEGPNDGPNDRPNNQPNNRNGAKRISVRAPGAAPTFCDEAGVRCVSGTYDVPGCMSEMRGLRDVSGVRAVIDPADADPNATWPSDASMLASPIVPTELRVLSGDGPSTGPSTGASSEAGGVRSSTPSGEVLALRSAALFAMHEMPREQLKRSS